MKNKSRIAYVEYSFLPAMRDQERLVEWQCNVAGLPCGKDIQLLEIDSALILPGTSHHAVTPLHRIASGDGFNDA
jgi:hypothetical protein